MKKTEIHLTSITDDNKHFTSTMTGNVNTLAKMITAALTYHPELFKKTFEEFMNRIYGGENND